MTTSNEDTRPWVDGRTALRGLSAMLDEMGQHGSVPAREYVYDHDDEEMGGCVYSHNGQPSCLIGHYLHRVHGMSVDDLEDLDFSLPAFDEAVENHFALFPVRFTRDAITVLHTAQAKQDEGSPWGVAEREAEAALAACEAPPGPFCRPPDNVGDRAQEAGHD